MGWASVSLQISHVSPTIGLEAGGRVWWIPVAMGLTGALIFTLNNFRACSSQRKSAAAQVLSFSSFHAPAKPGIQ